MRFKPILILAWALLLAWMHYWASEYVSRSNSRAYAQYRIAAEFEPIADPPASIWTGDKTEYFKQMGEGRAKAAEFARQDLKVLAPSVAHARTMLIDVSAWMTGTLALFTLLTYFMRYRVSIVSRSPAERSTIPDQ